jgi:hypothetical protein
MKGKITTSDVISSFGSGFVLAGDDYSDLDWQNTDIPKPTEAEVNAKIVEMQAEYDAQAYARNRKEEYDLLNQLELQFDDEENGTTTWKDAINAIKAKYPKPE